MIAAEAGYRSESSFTGAFTDKIGISPRKFRELPLGHCRRRKNQPDRLSASSGRPVRRYEFQADRTRTAKPCSRSRASRVSACGVPWTVGPADKILDYADRFSFCLSISGLSSPGKILIRCSRYQNISFFIRPKKPPQAEPSGDLLNQIQLFQPLHLTALFFIQLRRRQMLHAILSR